MPYRPISLAKLIEKSPVRRNLLTKPGYTPYCGNVESCRTNPRTVFNHTQFQCPSCGWTSDFDHEFIAQYRAKWKLGGYIPKKTEGCTGKPPKRP